MASALPGKRVETVPLLCQDGRLCKPRPGVETELDAEKQLSCQPHSTSHDQVPRHPPGRPGTGVDGPYPLVATLVSTTDRARRGVYHVSIGHHNPSGCHSTASSECNGLLILVGQVGATSLTVHGAPVSCRQWTTSRRSFVCFSTHDILASNGVSQSRPLPKLAVE